MSKENYKTHTILQPKDCNCDGTYPCPVCDGGLSFCTVCKGGEIELEEQSCEERIREKMEKYSEKFKKQLDYLKERGD